MPPHLLITANQCSETSLYAAIIFKNPIFIYAICFGRNLRDVYPQINGKESVHVFSEARYICGTGRVGCTHLNSKDMNYPIRHPSIECPPLYPKVRCF